MRLLLIALALAPTVALGQVEFKVCGNAPTASFTTKDINGKQTVDTLFVVCPPDAKHPKAYRPFKIVGCVSPSVKRTSTTYSVTCKSWNKYELVPTK